MEGSHLWTVGIPENGGTLHVARLAASRTASSSPGNLPINAPLKPSSNNFMGVDEKFLKETMQSPMMQVHEIYMQKAHWKWMFT